MVPFWVLSRQHFEGARGAWFVAGELWVYAQLVGSLWRPRMLNGRKGGLHISELFL